LAAGMNKFSFEILGEFNNLFTLDPLTAL